MGAVVGRKISRFFVCGDVLNKSIRKKARSIIKRRKRRISSAVFSFLVVITGMLIIRNLINFRITPRTVAAGIALYAVYFVIKSGANYRLQAQMIMLLSNGGEPVISIGEYAKNTLLTLCLSALRILELFAFEAVPGCIAAVLFFSIKRNALSAASFAIMLVCAAVTAIFGFIFYVFSVQKYAGAPFLLAAYPLLSVRDCIRLSAENGKNKAAALLRFKLGFLPWLLACAAIFPLLFVVPYYKQSLTCWFKQES